MPTSYQEPAAGSKSAKFVTQNPLDPIIRPFENEQSDENLADNVNERLTKAMAELKVKHATGTNEIDDPNRAPTGAAYQQHAMMRQQQAAMNQQHANSNNLQQQSQQRPSTSTKNGDDDDDDYDWLLDDEDIGGGGDADDDAILEMMRERRLAELKQAAENKAADLARGHGQVRTIAQDDFLPECTGSSEWVAVHFFHKEFERCKIMDHHLKIVAVQHTECKFLRIDAEKAPFFVAKLQIKTLPSLLVFKNGKVVDRLVGFEGLQTNDSSSKQQQQQRRQFSERQKDDPDAWETSALEKWIAKTGAIKYTPAHDGEESEVRRQRVRGCLTRSGIRRFDEDDEY